MELTDLNAFNRAWDKFEDWLATNLPDEHATLRPPATAEEIASVEATYGFPCIPNSKRSSGATTAFIIQSADRLVRSSRVATA